MFRTIIGYIVIIGLLVGYQGQCSNNENWEGRELLSQPVQITQGRSRIIVAEVTAYSDSTEECGSPDGIMANGEHVYDGACAADDLPFGTKVVIQGKEYIVADRFGGGYVGRIDIYMPSRGDCYRFGRQWIEVEIMEAQS